MFDHKSKHLSEAKLDENRRRLTLADFDYPCPAHLIAQQPRPRRDESRLLIRTNDGQTRDRHVSDLTTELPQDSLLILNDTRVFPSRLRGHLSSGGAVEIFLLEPQIESNSGQTCRWQALGRPMKKLKSGTELIFAESLKAKVVDRNEDGVGNAFINLEFQCPAGKLASWLDINGYIPLPPYIKRPDAHPAANSSDRDRYQTVYAQQAGSVAAPTAGLHFTDSLLDALKRRGIQICFVSLHVGAGTFLPVKTDEISSHKMHKERYRVGTETARALQIAKEKGRKIIAVGTTTLRSLESLYRIAGKDHETFVSAANEWRTTDIFIHPEYSDDLYKPWVIDGLVTNFHQPCSTLFMLVSALIGLGSAKELYQTAISREYRLFSYGDATLLWF